MIYYKDLIGNKYGKVVILELLPRVPNKQARCIGKCDCGVTKEFQMQNLVNGGSISCGCVRDEVTIKRSTTYGFCHTRIDRIYKNMKGRCYNVNHSDYNNYGKRGIKVCQQWLSDKTSFFNWAFANGYSASLELDRTEVNGDYSPENCRWIIHRLNTNNTRRNLYIQYKGETKTLSQWCELLKLSYQRTHTRLHTLNWSTSKAFEIKEKRTRKNVKNKKCTI